MNSNFVIKQMLLAKRKKSMKKSSNLFTLFLCVITLAIGTISCESQEQKEARAKALAEKQRIEKQIEEQFKTIDGFRQYLKGKTFVYCEDYHYRWVKVTFSDLYTAVLYEAISDDRSWGKGETFTYKISEEKDVYGKKTGGYTVHWDRIGHYSFFTFYPNGFPISIAHNRRGNMVIDHPIYLTQCDADYIPSQWKD